MEINVRLKFNHGPITMEPNYKKIPTNIVTMTDDGAAQFNRILEEADKLPDKGYSKIERTPSGGISISRGHFYPPCYDIRTLKSCIELTVIDLDGCCRVQFRTGLNKCDSTGAISGYQSWKLFVGILKSHDIDIHKYAIDNGEEVKATIPKAMIGIAEGALRDLAYPGVHHIDINSAHMAGVAEAAPELLPVIEEMYINRKTHLEFKAILTHAWGYMQSQMVGYSYAHLSKAGLEFTNRKVQELARRVIADGGIPLLYNTDGFWYCGNIYHGEGEGKGLGQWRNDYVNCKIRIKSNGCYEFIDNTGKYHPVMRGYTRLDAIKDRENWVWGDIYDDTAEPIQYAYSAELNRIVNDRLEIM